MMDFILIALAVTVVLIVLGIAVPAMTQSKADEPPKNPHFTRRVFGMHKK